MAKQLTFLGKRMLPLMLAIMVIASAVFVPTVISAATEEEYTALGLHAPIQYDFEDGDTSAFITDANGKASIAVPEGESYAYIADNTGGTVKFGAYGDIETYSFDIKIDKSTSSSYYSPSIIFYEETYTTTKDGTSTVAGTSVTSSATLDFGYSTTGGWNLRTRGLGTNMINEASSLPFPTTESEDGTSTTIGLSDDWATVTLTYGTAYYDFTSTSGRNDANGNTLKAKYISGIKITMGDTVVLDKTYTNTSSNYSLWRLTYGVNQTLTDSEDNENVVLGFDYSASQAVGISIDNIKVTYRNAEKVISYINDIGDVALTDTCKAAIEKAEAAYALLETEQQSAVTNYATLTAARAAYNELVENADVAAVIEQIAAIGTVDASAECLAKIEAAEAAYAALTAEKQAKVTNYKALVNARADYNNAKYGYHTAETIDFTDSVSSTIEGTTANSLTVNGTADSIYYNAYGDINTVSYDMYVHSTATTGTVNLPGFRYFDFDANTYDSTNDKDRIILSLQSGTLKINAGEGWPQYATTIDDYSTLFEKWVTVEYKYSSEYQTARSDNNRKYIEKITIRDGDTTIVDWDINAAGAYYQWMLGYGVDIKNYPDAKDPETVKIGFIGQGTKADLKNLKVTYKNTAAVEKVNAITTLKIDNTAACAETVADIKATYALFDEAQKTAELTAAIAAAEASLEVVKNATDAAPTIDGATIRATMEQGDQNIRYNSTMPTGTIEGYSIVEYGAVMYPAQLLGENEELTLDTTNGTAVALNAKATVAEGDTVPAKWYSELYGIDYASMDYCGLRIAARSYVKYSNGENTIIFYSNNDVDGYSTDTPTQGVNGGVCIRSVYGIARNMATAILDTTTYSEADFGAITETTNIKVGTIISEAAGIDVLEFVYNNQTRLGEIAKVR